MEMSLKQSTLVLLTVAVAVMAISDQVNISLDEKPKRREVHVGSNLNLSCNLSFEEYERIVVVWFFNSSRSSFNETREISKKIFNTSAKNSSEPTKTKQDFSYILSNVKYNHSGWYFCKVTVEIPILKVNKSQAAEVVVVKTVTEHTTYKSQVPVSPTTASMLDEWWMWIVLGVSVLILIVLLIICVLMKRRLHRRRASECPVYANTRPSPSPRPGTSTGNLKTVYSSQNLQTPSPGGIYETGKRKYRQ